LIKSMTAGTTSCNDESRMLWSRSLVAEKSDEDSHSEHDSLESLD
jgi:hypothetical protein